MITTAAYLQKDIDETCLFLAYFDRSFGHLEFSQLRNGTEGFCIQSDSIVDRIGYSLEPISKSIFDEVTLS